MEPIQPERAEAPEQALRPPLRWLPLCAAVLFTGLALDAARLETPTIDEFAHLPAGAAYLEHGSFALYAKNPPLMKVLMALPVATQEGVIVPEPEGNDFAPGWGPWLYGQRFMRANAERYLELFFWGRVPVIVLTLATGGLLFAWARRIFDERAAAVTTTLFLLSPLVLAHGHLATVDAGSMFTILLAAYAFRWAYLAPSLTRVGVVGGLLGVALLVKFTALLLVPAFGILIAAFRWRDKSRACVEFGVLGLCALLTVNLAMGFRGSFRPLGEFALISSTGRTLAGVLPAPLPVPLPADFVLGFDAVRRDTERGEAPTFLLGEWSKRGAWYYNLVALGAKTPIPFLVMLAASPWFLLRRRLPRRELALLLLPCGLIFVSLALFNRATIGIRYLLPIFPFLFVMIASVWSGRERVSRLWPAVVALYLFNAALIHPNYLTFFNWGVGGPGGGHRILLDSNLDWGQDLYRVPRALEEIGYSGWVGLLYAGHVDPRLYGLDYYVAPDIPNESVLAVSVSYLMGSRYPVTQPNGEMLRIGRDRAAWLRAHEPVAKLGSIWLYDTRSQRTSGPESAP